MITLIGLRCTHSNVLSREVLIRPFLLGNLEIYSSFNYNIPIPSLLFMKMNGKDGIGNNTEHSALRVQKLKKGTEFC